MYTVCIAEDEYYVQKSIEARIRALPFELVIKGIAADGLEAEKLYYSCHPDLFLVDISMPQCSGLEFIEKIRQEDPNGRTVFIIVSSYYDYENMRKAINVNVFDYLRKPIIPSEFLDIMERAVQQAETLKQEKTAGIRTLEEYLLEWQNQRISGTVLILMNRKGNVPSWSLRNELMELGDCVRIQLKNTDQAELLLFENQKITERQVERRVVGYRDNETAVFYRQLEQVWLEQDLKTAEIKMGCSYFENRLFYIISGPAEIVEFGEISWMFRNKKQSEGGALIERLWNEIIERKDGESLCQFFKQYVFWLVKKYDEEKIPFPEQLKRDLLLFSMARFKTISEIREYLQQSMMRYQIHVNAKRPAELVDQICEYVYANYAEQINLNELAAAFYISPSYLSHLFAKKKQMTIVKYIGAVRLEKAVEYLKNTEFSIAEIAERTGFSDGNYFAKAFKKKYGISPTDYRKLE